ncbi:HAD family hydrolase, a [hydrothermal vent metagenome]|uniref:HAD family hydrolase, a n=1 Tax=hydrothermal vent metagenome TaxID=652676 RepID=A0A1W1BP61_9ZZZZ
MRVDIPNYKRLEIQDIVCDYNGTIAKDGILLPRVAEIFERLQKEFRLHVITADTFGSVQKQLDDFDIEIKILKSSDHTQEKAEYIKSLGAENSIALGNGNNDQEMLKAAQIGIAILGDEGCSRDAMMSADIVSHDISDALMLFLEPKRLIATLRR